MTEPADDDAFELTAEQERALDLDRNISITAGAGTGKTTTLEERYRHILTTDPTVDPTDVVTITFTRDATAELRDGIRGVIDEQLRDAAPGEYDRWRRANDAVEDAYVHTIHGFCSRMLHEFAVEADIHPDVATLDETDAEVLVTRVAREIVIAALGEGGNGDRLPVSEAELEAIAPDVRSLARLYDRDELVSLMQGLVSERPESDRWADELLAMEADTYVENVFARAAPIDAAEADELAERADVTEAMATIQKLADLDCDFTADDDSGRATVNRIDELLPEDGFTGCSTREHQRVLLAICDTVTTGDGDRYSQSHYYAGSATRWDNHGLTSDHEALQTACETLIDALEPEARDLDVNLDAAATSAPYVFAIARIYRVIREAYETRKRTQNALDYTDLIDRTIAFLERDDAARRTLRDQFDYLMVDEVQDTDPRQWELVRLLSGSETREFDGQNVFLVGDEKQSIYRFRRADVTMLRRAQDQLDAANPDGIDSDEALSGNFRMLAEPLTFLNDLFDRMFAAEDPTGRRRPYEAEPQALTKKRTTGTDITGSVEYLVTPERDEDIAELGMAGTWYDKRAFASRADREAQVIAARLTRLFEDGKTVYDTTADQYRDAEPRDVALLFRTRSRLRHFEQALEEHDIPYTSTGGQSLYETPEITPLVNLLRVLHQPEREVPLYGVLRSPLFGFTDDEIAACYHPTRSLWAELQDADERLGTAGDRLLAWREACGLVGSGSAPKWGAFLSRIIDETGYLVSIGADERPQQAVVNVNQFRETLREWEEGSALPLSDILARIEREQTFGDTVGEGEMPRDVAGVQLRTVHSAKGLEFPIVVVPELGRGTSGGATISHRNGSFSTGLAYLEELDGTPVLGIRGPDPTNPVTTTKTPDWQLAEARQAAEERAEAKRVLYVATTRARDHLILSSTHRFDPDEEAAFGPYETGENASCWRDWVQPILLEDRDLLSSLRTNAVAECALPTGTYRVRRPPTPVPGPGATDEGELAYDLEIPSPDAYTEQTTMAVTAFRDLVNGVRDEAARVTSNDAFFAGQFDQESVSSQQFGTLVHRLCELQLSGVAIDWDDDPYRLVPDPDQLTPTDIDQAQTHVDVGVNNVEALERDLDVVVTADELQVTLELDAGEIVGDIDHLTVTDDRYYVTDYKTDSLAGRDIEDLAVQYRPQLQVYACALQQADPKQEVVVRLVFTETADDWTESLGATACDTAQREFNRMLRDHC